LSHGSLGRFVLRFRWLIVGFWLVVLLAGGFAASKLTPLLSNTFTVLGADSERARAILQEHFGDRSDGEFLVVFRKAVLLNLLSVGASYGILVVVSSGARARPSPASTNSRRSCAPCSSRP